jgi:energy-coupling factor transport system permease protein
MLNGIAATLDPRVKIFAFLSWISLAFICRDIYSIAALLITSVAVLLFVGAASDVFRRLRLLIPLVLLAFPLWTFLNQWSLFYASNRGVDFLFGLFMTLRLLLIVTASLAFIVLVKPAEIISAIQSLRLPPVIGATIALAFRYLYIISEDYKSIKEAHLCRGLELDKGSLIKRIRSYIPLLVPLIIRSIDSAEKLVLALELRPYIINIRRIGPLKIKDLAILLGCVLILVFAIIYNFYFGGLSWV